MEKFKSFLTLKSILITLLIFVLYFSTRFYRLTLIPVFVDEAIYIRWSQVMKAEPTLRFLPLSDGKQPLFMWLTMPSLKLFSDPLIAGRATSIFSGFITLTGLSLLAFYLTRSRFVTWLTAVLYIFIPYTFFFDRMSLVDSLLSGLAVWSILLGLLIVKTPRPDLAMIQGVVLGSALITKSPGLFFVCLQPVFLLSLPKITKKHLVKIILCWLLSSLIAFIIYNLLRLGPNFHLLNSRNQDYIFSIREVLSHPLNPLTGNLKKAYSWYQALLTLPILILSVLSFISLKNKRTLVALSLWIVLPLIFQSSIAKVYTARYLLYTVPPLILLAAISLSALVNTIKHKAKYLIITGAFILPFISLYHLYTKPENINLPQNEKHGYFQEWTAGYGQKQVADYLKERAKSTKVFVGTEGYFGTLPDGLQIYTEKVPNLTVIGVGQPIVTIPTALSNSLGDNEVYLVVNQNRNQLKPHEQSRLQLISTYEKPPRPDGSHETLQFYRLIQ